MINRHILLRRRNKRNHKTFSVFSYRDSRFHSETPEAQHSCIKFRCILHVSLKMVTGNELLRLKLRQIPVTFFLSPLCPHIRYLLFYFPVSSALVGVSSNFIFLSVLFVLSYMRLLLRVEWKPEQAGLLLKTAHMPHACFAIHEFVVPKSSQVLLSRLKHCL